LGSRGGCWGAAPVAGAVNWSKLLHDGALSSGPGSIADRAGPPGRFTGEAAPVLRSWDVRKHILLYGLLGGALIALLKAIEYRYLVVEHSVEIYGGLVALLFALLGIWLGLKLTRNTETVVVREVVVPAPATFVRDETKLESLGITPRELEVLELMAAGLSNREIAARVYVSENTVKTHSSRVFDKLGARRRTQAVQMGKELRLIP
jgi:DNA-binding CsgD family transcriptional regulator